jgi:hypothetical protein
VNFSSFELFIVIEVGTYHPYWGQQYCFWHKTQKPLQTKSFTLLLS